MEVAQKVYGEDSQFYFMLACNIGGILQTQGKIDEAIKHFQEIIEKIKSFNPNDPLIGQLTLLISSIKSGKT